LQHICKAHKTHCTKANLEKELQLPSHGKQSFYSGKQNTKRQKQKNRLTAAFLFLWVHTLRILLKPSISLTLQIQIFFKIDTVNLPHEIVAYRR